MKIAVITTESREHFKDYEKAAPYFGTAPEALFQGFAGMAGIEVHVISCVRRPLPSPYRMADNIWYHALLVPKVGWMTTLYQGCIRAVRRKLREIQPDLVHGQGTERDCAMDAVYSGYPNVLTIHGNMAELARLFGSRPGSYGWLAGKLEHHTLRRTAGVFCNSAYTESLVAPRTRRTWRVANAIRSDFFAPATDVRRPTRPLLVNVGHVSPRKRQLELLDLAGAWHRQGLDFELQFVGTATTTNPYVRAFLEKIKPLEAAGVARYVGAKSVTELIACFDSAAALIHFPTEEAFGLVVAEALARGVKLFGARVGGIVDIAADIPGARLVAVDDWDGMGREISGWLREGCPPSGETGRIISDRYSPRVIAQRHVEIYREVLSVRS